jgi:hypothetical protein
MFFSFKNQNSNISLPVKWCIRGAHFSVCVQLKERSVYKIYSSDYPCIPSISPDNREYTLVPTILFESPSGPSDKRCLGPANPLIRPCPRCVRNKLCLYFKKNVYFEVNSVLEPLLRILPTFKIWVIHVRGFHLIFSFDPGLFRFRALLCILMCELFK